MSRDLPGKLYERVEFTWGAGKEPFKGSIAQPYAFKLNWPGHINHGEEVFAVLCTSLMRKEPNPDGILFVRSSQMTVVPETALEDEDEVARG